MTCRQQRTGEAQVVLDRQVQRPLLRLAVVGNPPARMAWCTPADSIAFRLRSSNARASHACRVATNFRTIREGEAAAIVTCTPKVRLQSSNFEPTRTTEGERPTICSARATDAEAKT
jgi:hypothetical protein